MNHRSSIRRWREALAFGVAAGLGLCCLGGCDSPQVIDAEAKLEPVEPPPLLADVVDAYNAGTVGLDRLWARTTAKIQGLDAQGKVFDEQLEGHIQIERPGRLALTLGKLGDTMFYLGSNEDRAWWFDLWSEPRDAVDVTIPADGSARSAEIAQALGLPVHPHDLVLLMGLVPLEPSQVETVTRTPEGGLELSNVRLRRGVASMTLDPTTSRPTKVVLRDDNGGLVAQADLTRYGYVVVEGDATIKPLIAERVMMTLGDGSVSLRLTLWDPANKSIRSMVFDPDRLAKIYKLSPRDAIGSAGE